MTDYVPLDAIDRQILVLLQDDGRRTIADVARHVGLSSAPVKRRIQRLEHLGVIAGYSAVLDHTKLGAAIEAFTEVRFSGTADADLIVAAMTKIPEIREIYTMAGDPDAVVRVRVDDVAHLKRVVNELRGLPDITGTKSLIVLERWGRAAKRVQRAGRASHAAPADTARARD